MNQKLSSTRQPWLVPLCLLFVICVSVVGVRQASACRRVSNSLFSKSDDKLKLVGPRPQNPLPSPSPTPSPSDIFLVEVTTEHGQMSLGQPLRITEWAGYNNQPFFFPDGQSLLYTSIRADKQADIYKYDLKSRSTTKVTDTAESEFSPTLTLDGRFISVVRVEADSTQRLWKFPIAGGPPALILQTIKPVGYHIWIDPNTLALFVLGKPNTLQIVDARTEKAEVIAENIGRATRRIPGQNKLSFVHKVSDQEWIIKTLDLGTRQIAPLIKTLPGSEEYAWTPSGVLLSAKDTKLFAWQPDKDKDWREVWDFSKAGFKSITRIAVSNDGRRLAIVAHRE
jgi:WD40-like Beta Propeller Repeat